MCWTAERPPPRGAHQHTAPATMPDRCRLDPANAFRMSSPLRRPAAQALGSMDVRRPSAALWRSRRLVSHVAATTPSSTKRRSAVPTQLLGEPAQDVTLASKDQRKVPPIRQQVQRSTGITPASQRPWPPERLGPARHATPPPAPAPWPTRPPRAPPRPAGPQPSFHPAVKASPQTARWKAARPLSKIAWSGGENTRASGTTSIEAQRGRIPASGSKQRPVVVQCSRAPAGTRMGAIC
jgi:hypothetical protein